MAYSASNEEWRGQWTAAALVVVLCTGISISNALELLLLVLITFKRRKGLYFWSLLVASFSILPYSVGFLVGYLQLRHYTLLGDIMNNIGWGIMVTGQSVVLYSRLGVILHNEKELKFVLWMIIADGLAFYSATTIIHYVTFSRIVRAAVVMEKIQMTGFCIQEFTISGLYVREVWRLSKVLTQKGDARRTMWELLVINLVIIILDIVLLSLEYLSLTVFEQAFKSVVYSFKLKMEIAILGKLVSMAKSHSVGQVFRDSNGPPFQTELPMVHTKRVATHLS